jgi:hypothetical protein
MNNIIINQRPYALNSDIPIGKSVKVLDKVGPRTSALDALEALEKLDVAQTTHLKNRSSFKQLRTHIS